MKIFIEYDTKNQSGKGKFLGRLTRQWDKTGVAWSENPKGCNVRLAITRFRTKSSLPTVIRIDGSHHDTNEKLVRYSDLSKKEIYKKMRWKNRMTAGNIRKSWAVIWQSDFCRAVGERVFEVKGKRGYVIFNGADPADYGQRTKNKNIVMSARWKDRPHKRLHEMVKICGRYIESHPEVRATVLGDVWGNRASYPGVEYLGHCDEEKMKNIFMNSAVMLNLAYFDWCPNAVVEALVSGLPVICSAGTGVAEIVGRSGVVLKLDDPVKWTVKRAQVPPVFDENPVYAALDKVLYGQEDFAKPEHLYIETIAEKYYAVLKECYEHCK